MKPMVLDCGVWATKLCLSVYLRYGFCNIMSGVCRRYHTEWRKHCNGCSTVDCIIMILISPFPRLPTHGHDRPCRRDVGRVFLAGVRPDSPLRRRIPSCYCSGPGRGAAVEMGQRSVHQAHTTPVNSVHVSAPRADMFGDSVCAREADGTAAESWYVPLYEGVHPVCRLDSATGWRSGCRRAGGLVEPFVREKIQDWNRSA